MIADVLIVLATVTTLSEAKIWNKYQPDLDLSMNQNVLGSSHNQNKWHILSELLIRQPEMSRRLAISRGLVDRFQNFISDLPTLLPRMDPQECLKRSVCEAHHNKGKFGLLGIGLQLVFPPFDKNFFGTRVYRPLMHAARYGADRGADCAVQYDGCVVSLLKTSQLFVDHFVIRKK